MQASSSSPLIRVALVEDDAYFQQVFQDAVEQAPDMMLASVSGTLAQGLAALTAGAPDVLLVDIGLPDGSGIDLVRVAHERYPACNVMVCTTFGDEAHVMQSLEAGASSYLLKDSAAAGIVAEIRSLHGGGSPISPLIARQVLMRFRGAPQAGTPAQPPSPSRDDVRSGLSARETEVLEYITRGFTADEIAGLMQISRHTVLTFIRRIYAKLEVHSKAEAIFEARSRGLIRE
ncbi:MAG: DNA-binding transcriptional activator DevR/DosR [Herbaspirillum frisingense]|uniref:DNA-binding transcriptional activator DevR/DosR n=1 Tax=Herbaspirillum frisingense TaxID=92645 RepID=A0A7V8JS47_9BURK|nr:MAG: DNA-binding transcriptional activator DevR/DosR [Herbaspirillum frisingense]